MQLKMEQEQKQLIPQQAWKEDMEEARREAPPQALEQTKDKVQEEAQQQIQQQAPQLFSPAQATKVADGTPSQQVKSAKGTYKARRAARKEERRHAREAKKATGGVGNIVTYDIKHSLEDYHKQLTNSLESYFPSIESIQSGKLEMDLSKNLSGVDLRAMRNFTHGFRKDSAGNPATTDDLKYQLEDIAFYDAFCSTNYTRRVPYLQRMVDEALSFDPKEVMFSDSNLQRNAAGLKSITSRMVYMEDVRKDVHNKFFFDELLSPAKREALDQALDIFMYSGPAFTQACQMRGVDPDPVEAPYLSKEDIADYVKMQEDGTGVIQQYQKKLETYPAIKDTLKQAAAERPTADAYKEIRELLEHDVQRLLEADLNVNVVYNKKASEKEKEELDKQLLELYTASLRVEKFLTLKHPVEDDRTLEDDLIKQREKYLMKSLFLKELVETKFKARKNQNRLVP